MARGSKRKNNPVPLSKRARLKSASDLYENFTGNPAKYVEEVEIDNPDVVTKIGTLDGVLYTTEREGIIESYIHKFSKKSRPLLCVSFDGKHLVVVGGRYTFTDRGIVDEK